MSEVALDDLRKAGEGLHHCKATYLNSEMVVEEFRGEKVWERVVHQFSLTGHATAHACYAWSAEIAGSSHRQCFAILRLGSVMAPKDAVRASILGAYKARSSPPPP